MRFQTGRPWIAVMALGLLLAGIAATGYRTVKKYQTPGPFDRSRQGMCDFHNGVYFPVQAILRGDSPYSAEYAAEYPVARQIPFFLPQLIVLHAPLALLPLPIADVVYFAWLVGVMMAIAFFVARLIAQRRSDSAATSPIRWDQLLLIAAGIVFSRGGHTTLFNGYFTLELVLATFVAFHYGDKRPWVSAIALSLIASKPTYLLPLGFLMLARGNYRALFIGAILSIVLAVVPMTWLAYQQGEGDMVAGFTELRSQIAASQELHRADPYESPKNSWTRIDALAIVAKWTRQDPSEGTHLIVMAVLLIPAMWKLHRRRREGNDDGLLGWTGAIVMTAILVSLYHQAYDALILVAPLVGLLVAPAGQQGHRSKLIWLVVVCLMALPLANYFSTQMVLGGIENTTQLGRIVTSINGIGLFALYVILLVAKPIQNQSTIQRNSLTMQ